MEIQGIFLKKSDVKKLSETFSLQECYIDCTTFDQYTGKKYENILRFQFANQKMSKITNLVRGQRVKIKFAPRGRFIEKEDGEKFYIMNLDAWDAQVIDNGHSPMPQAPSEPTPQPVMAVADKNDEDLPFNI